jgi:hypothetical protein
MTLRHSERKTRMKTRLAKAHEVAQQRHNDHMALPAIECRKFACAKHDEDHLRTTGPCLRDACQVHHKPLLVHFRRRRRDPRLGRFRSPPRAFNRSSSPVPPPGRGR